MNKASPVELRVSIEMAHNRLHDTAMNHGSLAAAN